MKINSRWPAWVALLANSIPVNAQTCAQLLPNSPGASLADPSVAATASDLNKVDLLLKCDVKALNPLKSKHFKLRKEHANDAFANAVLTRVRSSNDLPATAAAIHLTVLLSAQPTLKHSFGQSWERAWCRKRYDQSGRMALYLSPPASPSLSVVLNDFDLLSINIARSAAIRPTSKLSEGCTPSVKKWVSEMGA